MVRHRTADPTSDKIPAPADNRALLELRDVLLETYAVNDRMNQLLLEHLDPRAWRAKTPWPEEPADARLQQSSRTCTTGASYGSKIRRRT